MIRVYTNEEYCKSYTELIEILKCFSKSDLMKIPQSILKRYFRDRDKNYSFHYNPELDMEQQNVSKLTQILLANLYINYWASEEERKYLQNKDLQELEQIEKQKQKDYNIETIFNNRKKHSYNDNLETKSLVPISNKENIFKKIFYTIKHFLKLT